MAASFPTSLKSFPRAVNNIKHDLTANFYQGETICYVTSTTGSPTAPFYFHIDQEICYCAEKTATAYGTIANPLLRGQDGTSDVNHLIQAGGGEVKFGMEAHYLNDPYNEIEAMQADIGITGTAVTGSIRYKLSNTTGGHDHDGADSKTVSEANIVFTDVTTNNASATKHGYLPKLDNTGTKYLRDDGVFAAVSSANMFLTVPGTPTRVSDVQFTITDTGNAGLYDLLLSQGTVLTWLETTTFQTAIVESSSYAANTVTVNIIGNSLTAGFTSMKYSVDKARIEPFIIPGTIATGTDLAKTFYMPCAGYIIAADGYHKTAGTTNSTTYDINDDASTLFSSKLTIATGATTATFLSATDPSTLIAKDSLITIDCDSVSTTAPVEAYIYIYWFPQSWRYIS